MGRLIDRTGQRFGRLVVLEHAGRRGKNSYWLCLCDCGKEVARQGSSLSNGTATSCGCLTQEKQAKHGLYGTKLYRAYQNAKARCSNPKGTSWPFYGGRGIKFLYPNFEAFLADVGHPPSESHTLDRLDPDGHYEPGNCHWATVEEQASNRRSNVLITHQGKTQTLFRWAREAGLQPTVVWDRLNRYNWPIEKALATPSRGRQ